MRIEHVELLCCTACKGALSLSEEPGSRDRDDTVEFGVLTCDDCDARYPIIDGVAVFFRRDLIGGFLNEYEKDVCRRLGVPLDADPRRLTEAERKQYRVARNWSYQWNKAYSYTREDFEKEGWLREELFFKFIPIDPSDLKEKSIVIWCGGKGKEAYHVARYDPELIMVIEIGDEIYGIRKLIDESTNLLLVRCDMMLNPLRDGLVDYSICDHALQHVADYRLGFKEIVQVLKPGGTLAINVYSHENNFLITRVVEPLKKVVQRLPIGVQNRIAVIPAVVLYCLIHFGYGPAGKWLPEKLYKKLPLYEHMAFWSDISYSWIRLACFDLLQAVISHHFRREELEAMAAKNGVRINKLVHTHGTTWSMIAHKGSKTAQP